MAERQDCQQGDGPVWEGHVTPARVARQCQGWHEAPYRPGQPLSNPMHKLFRFILSLCGPQAWQD